MDTREHLITEGAAMGFKFKHFTYLQGITLLRLGERETKRNGCFADEKIAADSDIEKKYLTYRANKARI